MTLQDPGSITPLPVLYRHMWTHALGARRRLIGALGLLGGSQIVKLAVPMLAGLAINAIQTRGREGMASAGCWIAAILAVHAVVWALHGPARVIERGVALKVRRSVADSLYQRLAQAPLTWHERHHSGDLQHRVAQAGEALYGFTQSQFLYLQKAASVIGSMAGNYQVLARARTDYASADVIRAAPQPRRAVGPADANWRRLELRGIGLRTPATSAPASRA